MTKTELAVLGAIIWLCCPALPAVAQERAGEVLKQLEQHETLPKERRPLPAIEPAPKKDGEAVRAVSPEDTTPLFIKNIVVDGAGVLDADEIGALTRPVEGKQQTLAGLHKLADSLTTACRAKGYITSYAYIPPQEIKDGVFTIKVVAGVPGAISVSGNRSYGTDYIRGHLEKLGKGTLNESDLVRQLLILNENASLEARANLKAGTEVGATDILVTVKDKRPLGGSLSYDNFGTSTISTDRLSANFNLGNMAFDGDMLMLGGMLGLRSLDIDKLSYGRAEYRVPVNYSGTRLGIYYSNSLYQAGGNIAGLELNGKANVAGLYASHPLIRQTARSLTHKVAFEYKDVSDYMLGSLNSRDKIRTLQSELSHDFADSFGGNNVITAGWVMGIKGFLGGATGRDAKSSRPGAEGWFNRFTLDAARYQSLGGQHRLVLKAGGQYSGDELYSAEQYQAGGAYSVRGYKAAARSGDSGYTLGAELHLALLTPTQKSDGIIPPLSAASLFLVPFADHAGVYRNNPHAGERSAADLTSVGTGLRFYWGNLNARLDCAVPTGGWALKNTLTWLQVALSF